MRKIRKSTRQGSRNRYGTRPARHRAPSEALVGRGRMLVPATGMDMGSSITRMAQRERRGLATMCQPAVRIPSLLGVDRVELLGQIGHRILGRALAEVDGFHDR